MRKMGTIMVNSDRGVPLQAIMPNVQIRANRTEPVGMSTDRTSLKRQSNTRAMIKNVTGGSFRKSLCV